MLKYIFTQSNLSNIRQNNKVIAKWLLFAYCFIWVEIYLLNALFPVPINIYRHSINQPVQIFTEYHVKRNINLNITNNGMPVSFNCDYFADNLCQRIEAIKRDNKNQILRADYVDIEANTYSPILFVNETISVILNGEFLDRDGKKITYGTTSVQINKAIKEVGNKRFSANLVFSGLILMAILIFLSPFRKTDSE